MLVCGEKVDLSDQEAAFKHMNQDDAHKKHLEKASILEQLCGTGILQRGDNAI